MTTAKNTADLSKLAHLLQPGSLVHTADGSVYRVLSKLADSDGFTFKLASAQGQPVATPDNFRPVSAAVAKFASRMRFKLAYNADFDAYVKEYIRRYGLPVDEEMNWSKWFQKVIVPSLPTHDSELQDEAIHHIIITTLAERSVLDPSNQNGFEHVIKRFPEHVQALPLDKQVSHFLWQVFLWRKSEAIRFITDKYNQKDTDSMWTSEEEGGEERNFLDSAEFSDATPDLEYEKAEIRADVKSFKKGFTKWLLQRPYQRENTVKGYLELYDLYWNHCLEDGGGVKANELRQDWVKLTKTNPSVFRMYWLNLPLLLQQYLDENGTHLGDTVLWELQVKDMRKHGNNLADKVVEHKVEPEDKVSA
jgi:hypothetical protein